jgi:hypothetical protein
MVVGQRIWNRGKLIASRITSVNPFFYLCQKLAILIIMFVEKIGRVPVLYNGCRTSKGFP